MSENNESTNINTQEITKEFIGLITEFVNDVAKTFPEYSDIIAKYNLTSNISDHDTAAKDIFDFCKKKYPRNFFEILYKNEDIFSEDSTHDTEFLPQIHFKNLWNMNNISDNTRTTIWKYLQLILFSITGSIDDMNLFGDSAKMFQAVNNDEFKEKLEEAMLSMKDMFETFSNNDHSNKKSEHTQDDTNKTTDGQSDESDEGNINDEAFGNAFKSMFGSNINMKDMPNADDLHKHISKILDGNLGKVAGEIAEEMAQDLSGDLNNEESMNDIFKNLTKNPNKLMGMVSKVTEKLENKMKSGDIKESELLSEASELMDSMKNMPGMDNFQSLFNQMGMGGLGGGGKVDTKASQEQLKRKMKLAKTKERILAKSKANEIKKLQENMLKQLDVNNNPNALNDDQLVSLFQSPSLSTEDKDTNNANKPKKSKKAKKKKQK